MESTLEVVFVFICLVFFLSEAFFEPIKEDEYFEFQSEEEIINTMFADGYAEQEKYMQKFTVDVVVDKEKFEQTLNKIGEQLSNIAKKDVILNEIAKKNLESFNKLIKEGDAYMLAQLQKPGGVQTCEFKNKQDLGFISYPEDEGIRLPIAKTEIFLEGSDNPIETIYHSEDTSIADNTKE